MRAPIPKSAIAQIGFNAAWWEGLEGDLFADYAIDELDIELRECGGERDCIA
jgi:hypothetical protein